MRTFFAQMLSILLVIAAVLFTTGCGSGQTNTAMTNPEASLRALEAEAGMQFPTNTVLLGATDGGSRNAAQGFYEWGLFSPTPIQMPLMKAPGVTKGYLDLPLDGTLESVQSMMGKRRISKPQSAFGSEWETNGYFHRGTIVRSPKGDYLVIQRFPIR